MAKLTAVPQPIGSHGVGERLLNDVFDLICERLPTLPLEDPARPALTALVPMLGQALGRPRVVRVGGER